MLWGYFMKIVIADRIVLLVDTMYFREIIEGKSKRSTGGKTGTSNLCRIWNSVVW